MHTRVNATQKVALSDITVDARCQPRVTMNPELVEDYAHAMQRGERFPALTVFDDGERHWLADGFHRYAAAVQIGGGEIDADVFDGDVRDAILYSVGANAAHGLRRGNGDKRRAVETLLNDPEWSQWSDREIARRCAVSDKTVASVRDALSAELPQIERTVQRGDSTYKMQTSNIGKRPAFPQIHGAVPADVLADLFAEVEDAEPVQEPLPPAINWEEGDRKAADLVVRCRSNVSAYDAERVAYAVAAAGPAHRERVMTEALELRLWLGELTHRLNKIK